MSLDKLRIQPGDSPIPAAWKQNGVLDELLAARMLGYVALPEPATPIPHPWRVSVARFEPPEEYAGPLDPAATWALTVAAGVINDTLPSILYQRTADPRGWTLLDDYATPQLGEPGYDPRWIERDALDDFDAPPFLILRDPPTSGATLVQGDFTQITDAQRPGIEGGAFCGEDTWELELWRAHVLLTATPLRATFFAAELPPPRLTRYRLATSPAKPSPNFGASAGGWIELATLYLLRDPAVPEDVALLVRQREFWLVWAVVAQPGGGLVDIFDTAADLPPGILPPGFTDLLRADLEDTLAGAATAEFWTV